MTLGCLEPLFSFAEVSIFEAGQPIGASAMTAISNSFKSRSMALALTAFEA
jgi:hypothetical protein